MTRRTLALLNCAFVLCAGRYGLTRLAAPASPPMRSEQWPRSLENATSCASTPLSLTNPKDAPSAFRFGAVR